MARSWRLLSLNVKARFGFPQRAGNQALSRCGRGDRLGQRASRRGREMRMGTPQTAATAIDTISDGAIDACNECGHRYQRQESARDDRDKRLVIDISPAAQDGSAAARDEVARQIRQASIA